jgi:hypothetical protein
MKNDTRHQERLEEQRHLDAHFLIEAEQADPGSQTSLDLPKYKKYLPNVVGLARAIKRAIQIREASWHTDGPGETSGYYDVPLDMAIRRACAAQWPHGDWLKFKSLIFILFMNAWVDTKYWAEDILAYAAGGCDVENLENLEVANEPDPDGFPK